MKLRDPATGDVLEISEEVIRILAKMPDGFDNNKRAWKWLEKQFDGEPPPELSKIWAIFRRGDSVQALSASSHMKASSCHVIALLTCMGGALSLAALLLYTYRGVLFNYEHDIVAGVLGVSLGAVVLYARSERQMAMRQIVCWALAVTGLLFFDHCSVHAEPLPAVPVLSGPKSI